MGRAPCCEKIGLKKGPWTPEEDQILISYINKFGHGNWRALPKDAGLLRCGKSCRLRWINYLRPDIKRGNFTKEEEDAIIHLHQILGNKWSAIAMRLPGRTDNEIKNVWNTHLKKRLDPNQNLQQKCKRAARRGESSAVETCFELASESYSSDFSFAESSSNVTEENSSINANGNDESLESRWDDGADEIEESFWIDALHMNSSDSSPLMKAESGSEDDVSFWLRVFAEAGDLQGLPDI